jgi:hypothetical protein
MSLNALYPLTGSMMLIGICAMVYGIQSLSLILFLQGLFLVWEGFRITVTIWEANRGDM